MQSPATEQVLKPAPEPTKRRRITPVVDSEMLGPLEHFYDLVAALIKSDDIVDRSDIGEQLLLLCPLAQQLASSKIAGIKHYAATDFRTMEDACKILGITYDKWKVWDPPDIEKAEATLSPEIDSVIQQLQSSNSRKIDQSEASLRVVIELHSLDRLHQLSDEESLEYLQLHPEVDINLIHNRNYITGRADWLLCHDNPQTNLDSVLLAIEARRDSTLDCADRQIATYLAAIQDSRSKHSKLHAIAFGITTDSARYQFWFLDSERQLVSSRAFNWRCEKARVIKFIDQILADAIEASPLTTPVLQRNKSLRHWERNFKQRQLLSPDTASPLSAEGLPLTITAPESSQLIGPAWYRGRKVMVIECDEDEELD